MLDRVTVIIPTYNRPVELARLLAFFSATRAGNRFLVLDSSAAPYREENRRTIERHRLDRRFRLAIDVREFEPSLPPYEKFALGLRFVETPYCAFCADDDLLFLPAVGDCVAHLETHKDFSIAHGYYFNFQETEHICLSYVQYVGRSIDLDDPIARLRQFMADYEATFYAVHRTEQLAHAMDVAQDLESTLFREVTAAAITIVQGKAARIPRFYYGRNTAPSLSYDNWHPHQILASDADLLFRDYARYRSAVLSEIERTYPTDHARLSSMFDHIHLKYLRQTLDPRVMEFILDEVFKGTPPKAIVDGVWQRWVSNVERAQHPIRPYPPRPGARVKRASRRKLFAQVFDRIGVVPGPVRRLFYPYADYLLRSNTAEGRPRHYLIRDEFLFPDDRPDFSVDEAGVAEIVSQMNNFEPMDVFRTAR